MFRKSFNLIFFLAAGIFACNKDMAETFSGFQQPENFPAPAYRFENNRITRAGFELGRKLFNDPILSSNNQISCSSCHIQTAAFSHRDHSISHGIFDRLGTRNSPAIMNLAWNTSFMWDGGVFDLDLQPIAPITNHVEMDDSLGNILNKLRKKAPYPSLFNKAFGSDEITSSRFLKALSQFMLMCVSDQSKYDSVSRKQAIFTREENEGYLLFQSRCSNCHAEPLFTDHSFRNNGIRPGTVNDLGRYSVTLHETDKYKFKVPGLRNLGFTPPYMHDGRFLTLEAVLDHYNSQVYESPNLDPLLLQNGRLGILLSAKEKSAILTFLKTLDDHSFVRNIELTE